MTELLLQAADWAPGLVDERTLYRYTAAVLGVVALGFLVWTARLSDRHRRFGLVATWIVAVMAVTYVAMSVGALRFESVDGNAIPMSRFAGYPLSIGLVVLLTGWIGGASRGQLAGLLLAFAMTTGGTSGGWFLPDPLNSGASLAALLSLPLVAYLLLRPVQRAANRTAPARKLLYGKLRNIVLLVWVGYLVVGIVSRQNLGLLDGFVGVFLGAYLDAVVVVAFGALLLRHTDALDDVVGADDGDDGVLEESPESDADADAPAAAD